MSEVWVIILSAYIFIFMCSINAATCVSEINNYNDNFKCDHGSGTFNQILSRSWDLAWSKP